MLSASPVLWSNLNNERQVLWIYAVCDLIPRHPQWRGASWGFGPVVPQRARKLTHNLLKTYFYHRIFVLFFSCLESDAIIQNFTRLYVSVCNCMRRLTKMSKSSVLFKPFKHLTIRQKRREKGKLFNRWEEAALYVTGKSFFNSSCLMSDVSTAFLCPQHVNSLH